MDVDLAVIMSSLVNHMGGLAESGIYTVSIVSEGLREPLVRGRTVVRMVLGVLQPAYKTPLPHVQLDWSLPQALARGQFEDV